MIDLDQIARRVPKRETDFRGKKFDLRPISNIDGEVEIFLDPPATPRDIWYGDTLTAPFVWHVRASSVLAFERFAIDQGLGEIVVDDEGQRFAPVDGISIVGPVQIVRTPAVFDADDNVITPPVMETGFHYNIKGRNVKPRLAA